MRRNSRGDGDTDYLERTAVRLRRMASTYSGAVEADADQVNSRLRNMTNGGSQKPYRHITTTD